MKILMDEEIFEIDDEDLVTCCECGHDSYDHHRIDIANKFYYLCNQCVNKIARKHIEDKMKGC